MNPQLFRNIHKLIACSAHIWRQFCDLRTQCWSCELKITCSLPFSNYCFFFKRSIFWQLILHVSTEAIWYHSISPNISNSDPSKLKPIDAYFQRSKHPNCFKDLHIIELHWASEACDPNLGETLKIHVLLNSCFLKHNILGCGYYLVLIVATRLRNPQWSLGDCWRIQVIGYYQDMIGNWWDILWDIF